MEGLSNLLGIHKFKKKKQFLFSWYSIGMKILSSADIKGVSIQFADNYTPGNNQDLDQNFSKKKFHVPSGQGIFIIHH